MEMSNKSGGGRDDKISQEEQIILTLIYLRHHLNFQLLALMFKISESTAHNIFHKWQKILESALPCSLLEQVKKFEENQEEIKQILTNYELIVDSEEQEIERSLDYEQQKKHYSGKKKKHTLKNQIICLPRGEDIVDVVAGELGPKADITIWRENAYKFDEKQRFSGDKAYVSEPQIRTPKKKPKNGELTEEEKEKNKEISSERIFVEHIIRIIKIFKVMGERFRLKKEKYESVFNSVCGLVRLRMKTLLIEHSKNLKTGKVIDVLLTHIFSSELLFLIFPRNNQIFRIRSHSPSNKSQIVIDKSIINFWRCLMLQLGDKNKKGYLDVDDCRNFPREELRTIDRLWLKYSDGKFGFSVQKQIYLEEGGTLNEYNSTAWRRLSDRIGWRKNNSWLYYSDLTFNTAAPQGHLPSGDSWGELVSSWVFSSFLFSRL